MVSVETQGTDASHQKCLDDQEEDKGQDCGKSTRWNVAWLLEEVHCESPVGAWGKDRT